MNNQGESRTVSAEQLLASQFEHVETTTLVHPKHGVTLWRSCDIMARWNWQMVSGVVAIADPMRIQLNAQIVDEDGRRLTVSPRACVLTRLLHGLPWQERVTTNAVSGSASISHRELECLRLSGQGASVRDTATILGISQHTVSTHLRRATEKLEAPTRWQAVLTVARLGVI